MSALSRLTNLVRGMWLARRAKKPPEVHSDALGPAGGAHHALSSEPARRSAESSSSEAHRGPPERDEHGEIKKTL